MQSKLTLGISGIALLQCLLFLSQGPWELVAVEIAETSLAAIFAESVVSFWTYSCQNPGNALLEIFQSYFWAIFGLLNERGEAFSS